MGEPLIVVTGARSAIGRAAIRHLLVRTNSRIVAIVSPRLPQPMEPASSDRLSYAAHDLTLPLVGPLASAVAEAGLILHMAWHRQGNGHEQAAANRRMIENLLRVVQNPAQFAFFSSVAAGATAPSAYGYAKFCCESYVAERGGTNLVIGLLVDSGSTGGFRLLAKAIEHMPLSFRFVGAQPRAYPVSEREILDALVHMATHSTARGTYGLFVPGGMSLSGFTRALEAKTPRWRLPLPLPICLILGVARLLKAFNVSDLADRLSTFFWKDDLRLASLPTLPGVDGRHTLSWLNPFSNQA